MPDKILNSRTITGPQNYVVRDNDDILNIDTTLGIVTLVFANIRGSGFNFIQKQYYVNDIGNNASVNNIVLLATGGDQINSNASILLAQNGASVQVQISSQTEWLATGDIGSVITGDKNFTIHITALSTALGNNTGLPGVFPTGCTNCTNQQGATICTNPTLPFDKPNTKPICIISRPSTIKGGSVICTFNGFTN